MFEPRLGFLIEVEIISVFHILFILFFLQMVEMLFGRGLVKVVFRCSKLSL